MSAQALATGGARSHARNKTLGVAIFAASAMVIQLLGASAASAFENGDFRGTRVTGRAWGAEAKLTHSTLPNVSLGKVALQVLPCRPPGSSFNTVAQVKVPGDGNLVSTGVVENRGTSSANEERATVTESSTVANVSLLDNLVTARAVTARATTTIDADGKRNSGDTDFVDLVVDGEPIVDDEVGPNTTITLLGGTVKVVLNEQKTAGGRFQVNAIHVYVNGLLGYRGDIVVAHAETALADAPGHLSGNAYLSFVKLQVGSNVDPLLKALSGRQNVVYLPCAGGSRVSDAVNVTIPDAIVGGDGHVLESATSRSTVNGTITRTSGESHSTHTLEHLSLLNGRITADAVRTEANTESFNEGGVRGVRSDGNVTLVNLRIDGVLQANVTGTVTVNLPGIGFVRVNEKRCVDDQGDRGNAACTGDHYNAITVNALHVKVNTLNDILPVNAEIIVGSAHSDVNF